MIDIETRSFCGRRSVQYAATAKISKNITLSKISKVSRQDAIEALKKKAKEIYDVDI